MLGDAFCIASLGLVAPANRKNPSCAQLMGRAPEGPYVGMVLGVENPDLKIRHGNTWSARSVQRPIVASRGVEYAFYEREARANALYMQKPTRFSTCR